jgi:hypothetical protein
MATVPDPQFPTDKPTPNDKPGSNNTFLILLGGTVLAAGGWYYSQQSVDPHAQRKADEARAKQKAAELRDAGVATAHDAVKEGEKAYDDTKVSTVIRFLATNLKLIFTSRLLLRANLIRLAQVPSRLLPKPNPHSAPINNPHRSQLNMPRPPLHPHITMLPIKLRIRTTMLPIRCKRRDRAGVRGWAAG